MTIISKLRPLFNRALVKSRKVIHQSSRNSGHGMVAEPSGWTEAQAWDVFCYYTFCGAFPLICFGTFMSIFVGDAVLQETPEGYDPEDWECERNPISRLISRYILNDNVFMHEYKVGQIAQEQDSRMVRIAIEEVKRLQLKYRDYRAWYFQPTDMAVQMRADRYIRDQQEHYLNQPVKIGGEISIDQ